MCAVGLDCGTRLLEKGKNYHKQNSYFMLNDIICIVSYEIDVTCKYCALNSPAHTSLLLWLWLWLCLWLLLYYACQTPDNKSARTHTNPAFHHHIYAIYSLIHFISVNHIINWVIQFDLHFRNNIIDIFIFSSY